MQKLIAAAGLSLALAICSPVSAAELQRSKIGQWGDPLTPPQSRTSCSGYASGTWPWGGEWKTCNQWKTEWRHMEVEAFLVVSGPGNLTDQVRQAVLRCAVAAAVAAAGTGTATAGAGAAAAIAAAKIAFSACMTASGTEIASDYSIDIDTRTHWTDWG